MKTRLLISLALCSVLVGCSKTTPDLTTKPMDTNQASILDSPVGSKHNKFIPVALDLKTKNISDNGRLFQVERFERNGITLDKINLPSKIMFGVDQHKVNNLADKALAKLVKNYGEEFGVNYIYVVGHTDSDGPASYNVGLSSRRSMGVILQLKDYGVSASNLYVIPAGENMPLVPNDSKVNKSKNRRVEIYLSKSRDLALQYIRDAACHESVCRYAKVPVLKINRDFGMTNERVDFDIPESIVIMETDYKKRQLKSNKQIREIKAFPITVREYKILVVYRDYTPLSKKHLIKSSDKRRQRLSQQL